MLEHRHKTAGSSHPAPGADVPVYRLTGAEQESSNTHPFTARFRWGFVKASALVRHHWSLAKSLKEHDVHITPVASNIQPSRLTNAAMSAISPYAMAAYTTETQQQVTAAGAWVS